MIKLQKILVGVAIVVGGIFFVPQSAFALAPIPATISYSCSAYGPTAFMWNFLPWSSGYCVDWGLFVGYATYVYSCPAGYTLSGTSCMSSTLGTITTTSNIPTSWTITGPATITGSGTSQSSLSQPTGTYTIVWNPVAGYTTPASQSFTLTTGGTIAFSATYTALCTYSCPAGNTVIGSGSSTTCQAPSSCTYSCPAGSTLSGTTCQAPAYQPAGVVATATYSCPSGSTLFGTTCQAPAYQPAGVTATGTVSCPGTGNHGCSGNPMSCPSTGSDYCPYGGAAYGLPSPGFCGWVGGCGTDFSARHSAGPTVPLTTYSCPATYTLSGTTCYPPMVTPASTTATATYSCPATYTLSGTTCYAPSVTPAPTSATASCTAPARTSGIASASCPRVTPTVSFQGAGCILPVGGGSCNITAWWSVSGLPQGETIDINVTGPGIALNYKNLPADSTLLAQAVTKAQNLAAVILGFPTAKPQATPFVQPVSSTGSFSMSLLQHSNGATLATLPPLVSCPAGYTIVNGSCVAPVVLPCTAPNVTTWSSCQSSATCTTPPSQLTGQSGFRTGICPTPQYTGTVIEACSTATVTCTAPPTLCGNGICETGETFLNCSKDCKSKVQQF